MRSYLRRFLPVLVALAAAYGLCLFVATHLPGGIEPGIEHLDKVIHFLAYALLAFAIGSVITVWRGYHAWMPPVVWTLCALYGAIDEYTQKFVPHRTASFADLACDAAGAMFGLMLVYGCVLVVRRWKTEQCSVLQG